MRPDRLRLLAVAVAYGRLGYVLMVGDDLKDWQLSKKASDSPKNAREKISDWITDLEPNVIVTENVGMRSRKSQKTIRRIHAIALVAKNADVVDIAIVRQQNYKNKYLEAEALSDRFPQIKNWVPQARKSWQPEPRNTIYFEALSMALIAKGEDRL
ncbi:MAG: hypothetical protein HRU29_11915 [Rhizobiales bacterium]|nr:hypothetical protein [Hyphomicrobiales bacterium]NRB15095.1 hypothetical protein [Hyphomicrobiales bacterium]